MAGRADAVRERTSAAGPAGLCARYLAIYAHFPAGFQRTDVGGYDGPRTSSSRRRACGRGLRAGTWRPHARARRCGAPGDRSKRGCTTLAWFSGRAEFRLTSHATTPVGEPTRCPSSRPHPASCSNARRGPGGRPSTLGVSEPPTTCSTWRCAAGLAANRSTPPTVPCSSGPRPEIATHVLDPADRRGGHLRRLRPGGRRRCGRTRPFPATGRSRSRSPSSRRCNRVTSRSWRSRSTPAGPRAVSGSLWSRTAGSARTGSARWSGRTTHPGDAVRPVGHQAGAHRPLRRSYGKLPYLDQVDLHGVGRDSM